MRVLFFAETAPSGENPFLKEPASLPDLGGRLVRPAHADETTGSDAARIIPDIFPNSWRRAGA